MQSETFLGVVVTRPRMMALLSEDGESVTLFSAGEVSASEWASLLAELRRCGLPEDVAVVDEWIEEEDAGPLWVTVLA